MEQKTDIYEVPAFVIRRPILCRVGFHKWRDELVDGVNLLAPMFPRHYIQVCQRCKMARSIGHTLYGDNVYYFDDLASAVYATFDGTPMDEEQVERILDKAGLGGINEGA